MSGQTVNSIENYATAEAEVGGIPVYSFSNLAFVYGVSPDYAPRQPLQEGNTHLAVKIRPKKSWEIKYNLAGSENSFAVRDAINDSQPMLPIHLIDGDPETMWTSWEVLSPDTRPEWIRIDLAMETAVTSVALITAKTWQSRYGNFGKALPRDLEIRTSRDALHWDTVYKNHDVNSELPVLEARFKPRRVKQVWIIGSNFRELTSPGELIGGGSGMEHGRFAFSLGEVEVRTTAGENVAKISRGGTVTVSSTSYVMLNDRFTQDALWEALQYDLGNKWVRVGADNGPFTWGYVEHERGKVEVDSKADKSISECKRNGMRVIMNLDFKGNWIYANPPRKTNWRQTRFREINDTYNDSPPNADSSPEMYHAYLRYVRYMAEHFKDRVDIFEISNEWNAFTPEYYLKTFFEPTYKIIKAAAPAAKVMLGSPSGFDRDAILECLGVKRQVGVSGGHLLLDPTGVQTGGIGDWLAIERQLGAAAVRSQFTAADVAASADFANQGEPGILLRYKDQKHYLAASYVTATHSLVVREINGEFSKPVLVRGVGAFAASIRLTARTQGSHLEVTASDGLRNASVTAEVRHITSAGRVGVFQRSGTEPQRVSHFRVAHVTGKILVSDEFSGSDGTIPAAWKYVAGGTNPIAPGVGARIDAISWHPVDEPNSDYFARVKAFQQECRNLGFKGNFFATEIYAGSMYPPGVVPGNIIFASEAQMAKYLVKSLCGHNGLNMEAGFCNTHYTAYAQSQAACQGTWGFQTLVPCRPTMTYYMWRTVATTLDNFHAAEVPVRFSPARTGLLFFTFRRPDGARMLAAWIDGPEKETISEVRTDITFPGVQAKQASAVDIMNGTEQALNSAVEGGDTVLKEMLIKDYPVLIMVSD